MEFGKRYRTRTARDASDNTAALAVHVAALASDENLTDENAGRDGPRARPVLALPAGAEYRNCYFHQVEPNGRRRRHRWELESIEQSEID
jgi:hypothetical protein